MTQSPIELLDKGDAKALAALEQLCFGLPWTQEMYAVFLPEERKEPLLLSALWQIPFIPATAVFGIRGHDLPLAAYASFSVRHAAFECELYNIAVHPRYRRQGLGRFVLVQSLLLAGKCGIETCFLEVRKSNTSAIALYRQAGFIGCGERKKYYADTGEDALIMSCALDSMK